MAQYKIAYSCGIIPVRQEHNIWQAFIVQHPQGHWSFPKGHQNPTETRQQTAERELQEETGLTVKRYISTQELTITYDCISHGRAVYKTVTYFIATVEGTISLCPYEIIQGLWVDIPTAFNYINYPPMEPLQQVIGQLLALV